MRSRRNLCVHKICRRCGERSYNISGKNCVSCNFGQSTKFR